MQFGTMQTRPYKIAIISGEASGDLLAADLIRQLSELNQQLQIVAVGGKKVADTGVKILSDNQTFSVMGLAEVVRHLPKILRLKKQIVRQIIDFKPDVFIGVDAPDLNFSIAKQLKKHGISVIHYVSPSVWAWRAGRVNKMAKFIDHLLCLFPFEPQIYHQAGLTADFVGHPLAIKIQHQNQLASKPNNKPPILALLPGSRNREIATLMPLFAAVATHYPDWQVACCNVSADKIKQINAIAKTVGVKLSWFDDADVLLHHADLALLGSGTVALQALLHRTPMVVAYKISAITWFIVKTFRMLKLPYYSLPNVLYGGFLVPEVMQKQLTVDNLLAALKSLQSAEKQSTMLDSFADIHRSLLPQQQRQAALSVLNFLQGRVC